LSIVGPTRRPTLRRLWPFLANRGIAGQSSVKKKQWLSILEGVLLK